MPKRGNILVKIRLTLWVALAMAVHHVLEHVFPSPGAKMANSASPPLQACISI
jgi:uncharacterized radical SAM superfamily protein